jgi:simple sugar transport system permease protein
LAYGISIVAVAAVAASILMVSGYDVGESATALWRGAFGSTDAFVSSTLVRAVPLLLMGTAIALTFRVGVFNVGGDGQFLAGAATAVWLALSLPSWPRSFAVPLALLAGTMAGGMWSILPAFFRRRWGVFEVLSTLMMNFIAAYLISYLVRGPLQEPTRVYPQSATVPDALHLPIVIAGTRLHAGLLLALGCVVAAWLWLSRREGGFKARVTGSNPIAASSAGRIDTGAVTFRAFVGGASLCGLAGAVEVLGVTFALYENLSPGYGFTAIAVALLAGLHPLAVVPSAVLFAALDAGASAMQREAGVPSVTVWIIQALLILAALAAKALHDRRWGIVRLRQL